MDKLLKNLGGVTPKSLVENQSLSCLLQAPALVSPLDSHDERQDVVSSSTESIKNDKKQQEIDFEKKLKEVEGDYFAQTDFGAAFLGPNLWNKTYGNDDFNLEYMDLEEFLSENNLPVNAAEQILNKDQDDVSETATNTKEVAGIQSSPPEKQVVPTSPTTSDPSTSPVDVAVTFNMSDTDIALATIPGQDGYDPRKRSFSEEELKPQPMIKKSRKIYVPQEAKDDRYWDRRRKNNVAAKRSRDARRIKENQISMRAGFLEKENNALWDELIALKEENNSLKSVVKSYESKLKLQ